MKTIIYFYSRKGSNQYLANKLAKDLDCEIEQIKPKINFFSMILLGVNFGNRKLQSNPANYDRIILIGPVFMGKLIIPLKNFLLSHQHKIKKIYFVTCCGSSYEQKDEKFGHNHVLKEVKEIMQEKCAQCIAFPITLVFPPELKDSTDGFMKIHLNDQNFKGEIENIYADFVDGLKIA